MDIAASTGKGFRGDCAKPSSDRMHLLAAQAGTITDGTEPVDPDQSPGDVIFLSAADTDLAALSSANSAACNPPDFLRLAQLSWLTHPFSTDLYIDKTASKAKLVIVRALGGMSYWRYVLEQFSSRLGETGTLFAALPGDDRLDEELFNISSVTKADWVQFAGYCAEGGPDNSADFLALCRHLANGSGRPPPPKPLLRAGIYWPGKKLAGVKDLRLLWRADAPVVAIVFYRAMLQGQGLDPIDELVRRLVDRGLNPLPIFVASLKDPLSAATLEAVFSEALPDIVVNCTSFAVGSPEGEELGTTRKDTPLDAPGRPVLQAVMCSSTEEQWLESASGLAAKDIAMNVALPEVDGRIISRPISFKTDATIDAATQCPIAGYKPRADRIEFVADLALSWARLPLRPRRNRKVAIILANYPNKDGRLANGVGLDTPASIVELTSALERAGYGTNGVPTDSGELMDALTSGPTNWLPDRFKRRGGVRLSLSRYRSMFDKLPAQTRATIVDRWGEPANDPFCRNGEFALAVHVFGNVAIGIQPARGYNIDPVDAYHSPDLAPPHHYAAFYFWLRNCFESDAFIHMGKHGNLEWLPGKAVGLSAACASEAILGPVPNIYPFIVNDPGEGTQAKRRSQAVIIDHLTPPLTRAESYGALRELEFLVDEYYLASGMDSKRVRHLQKEILSMTASMRLDLDAGIACDDDADSRLRKIDAFLCEIKESQIRDGLHVFGRSPTGRLERDLVVALARIPQRSGGSGCPSLHRAISNDFGLGDDFDPLDCDFADAWTGARPKPLDGISDDPWRNSGDTVERIEKFAQMLVDGEAAPPGPATNIALEAIEGVIRPAIGRSGESEIDSTLAALEGKFVPPGPSGAPTRGRLDTLPTGRNFYSVDSRALPTRTAWELGWKSANLLIERFAQDNGEWPRRMAITAWGTSNMRTGGDDIAQALALMGAKPAWDGSSGRVTGFEILPSDTLGRPRVDVTLRISGFFRDAFPAQIDLVASAARAIMELDEPEAVNPAAASFRAELKSSGPEGAGYRVFGSKPGAYGAGLQAMIDEKLWDKREELGQIFLDWGGYAYGIGADGIRARDDFSRRLSSVEALVHNQDNREHDLLDSDDYYQFEGGMAAAVEFLRGAQPKIFHNDHSRPERPAIRTLEEELGRVVRSRAVNPKWIRGIMRHGYKGAFEIAATVDYLFAFAATTGAAKSHHFDLVYEAYLADDETREFIASCNPAALREIAERLLEAADRNLWQPRVNSARDSLLRLADAKA